MKKTIIAVFVLTLFLANQSYSQQAIVGGQDYDTSRDFVVIIPSPGASFRIVTGALGDGAIASVAINSSGVAIIGGQDNNDTAAFAAFVSPSGISVPILTGAVGGGQIAGVAINNAGYAIIGGQENGRTTPFAALVSPLGISTPISTGASGTGSIITVGINSSGNAVIGGLNNGFVPFAALVSPSGISTPIATGMVANGLINDVAINDAGTAIIGGRDNGFTSAFVALISPSGSATPIATGTVGNSVINGVAINNAGTAIIGGQENGFTTAFAALISPSGTLTPIATGAGGISLINKVAINSSGTAIIGGADNGFTTAFAALISPSGISTPITTGSVGTGTISDVAINDAGIALIGGQDNNFSKAFFALVSPSGISTPITTGSVGDGFIISVALALDSLVPQSHSTGNFTNALFALSSQVLPNHTSFYRPLVATQANETALLENFETNLLADASDLIYLKGPCRKETKYSLWASPFGYYAHQKKAGNFPAVTDWLGGVLVGFDYYGIQDGLIGGGVAYGYDDAHLAEGKGHAKTNQEFVTFYTSWLRKNFFINASIWGGTYQKKNLRRHIANITSTSHVDGWLLLPHLEVSFPFYLKKNRLLMNPFLMADWANNWQGSIHEKGAAGFNLLIERQYTSILRSEAGVKFLEYLQYEAGTLILEEKGSWVNLHPFNAGPVQTSFVGSASSFAIEVFRNKTQNLGAVSLSAKFFPCSSKYPYGSIRYQGEFGSAFQSHLVLFEIGKFF